jgi:hypothetical protein
MRFLPCQFPHGDKIVDKRGVMAVQQGMKIWVTLLLCGLAYLATAAHGSEESSNNQPDSTRISTTDSGDVTASIKPVRSPTGALLRSAVIPGWGQFYNRKYLKAAVVAAGEGYCLVQLLRYWSLADDAFKKYSVETDTGIRRSGYQDYDFYQDRRNLFLWLSGVTMFVSMFDAYVDAHLAGFDVDITPSFDDGASSSNDISAGLTLTVRF